MGAADVLGQVEVFRLERSAEWLLAENAEELVQQVSDLLKDRVDAGGAVKQAGDSAQQVAEEVARTLLCSDVQVDLVEVDLQAEQVEVQWPEDEVEDFAAALALGEIDRNGDLLRTGGRGTRSVSHGAGESTDGLQGTVLNQEPLHIERTGHSTRAIGERAGDGGD